jgi:hypothetical protein
MTVYTAFWFSTYFAGTEGAEYVELKVLTVFHALFANKHGGSSFSKSVLIMPHKVI